MADGLPPTRGDAGENSARVQQLVARCVEALERGDADAAESLLCAQPQLADQARAHLAALCRARLVGDGPQRPSDAAPEAIGPYRILEQIGRGGMGAVYLAEQRQPVHRRVALKLIKRGMDSHEIVARFAVERQALALMNHASIAKVFDAGTTESGQPFFVMEYVAGLPITTYCDRLALTTEQRLQLFITICAGVQHAHSKGIIHRDLKPSNVLIAEQDGKPMPKIIDFGVAKTIGQPLAGVTLHTTYGMVIGTPEYMSPEQAGRDALDIDTRSDVYSLGVLLYELLTGTLPFSAERLRTDYAEMQRILREEDPATPSKRVSTVGQGAGELAKARATNPPSLQRRLRGDLDWICLKALEKDRDRRYATVNDLAADVRRHLEFEPVLAGPPRTLYRLRKFVRRNRVQVAATAMVGLALLLGLVASLRFYADTRTALAGESEARRAAEANFDSALEAVDKLLMRIGAERLKNVPQMEQVRRELLQEAAGFYRRFCSERQTDPRTRLQAARAQKALARVARSLDDLEGAKVAARAAVQELSALAAERPDSAPLRLELAAAHGTAAMVHDRAGEAELARTSFAAAIAVLEAMHAAAPTDMVVRRALAAALHDSADCSRDREPHAAEAAYRAAIAHMQDVVQAQPGDAAMRRQLAGHRSELASVLIKQGQIHSAEQELRLAGELLALLSRTGDVETDLRLLQAGMWRKLAVACYETERLREARDAARMHVDIERSLASDYPRVPQHRHDLANALGNLAVILADLGENDAEDMFRAAVRELDKLVAEFPKSVDYRASLATQAGNVAYALLCRGQRAKLAEAEALAARAVDLLQERCREDPDNVQHRRRLVSVLVHLGTIQRAAGRRDEASAKVDAAVATAKELVARFAEVPGLQCDLADALLVRASLDVDGGEHARARAALDAGLSAVRTARGAVADSVSFRRTHADLQRLHGSWLARNGECAAAAGCIDELLALFGEDSSGLLFAGDVLRSAWQAAGKQGSAAAACAQRAAMVYDDAIRRFADELAAAPNDNSKRVSHARALLGRALLVHGQGGDARALLHDALPVLRTEHLEGHVDRDATEDLAAGWVALIEALLGAGDLAAAVRECDALRQTFADEGERQFTVACLRARCARIAGADDARACEHLDAAAATLRRAFACGFRDVARVRAAVDLELVRIRPEIEALLR